MEVCIGAHAVYVQGLGLPVGLGFVFDFEKAKGLMVDDGEDGRRRDTRKESNSHFEMAWAIAESDSNALHCYLINYFESRKEGEERTSSKQPNPTLRFHPPN